MENIILFFLCWTACNSISGMFDSIKMLSKSGINSVIDGLLSKVQLLREHGNDKGKMLTAFVLSISFDSVFFILAVMCIAEVYFK